MNVSHCRSQGESMWGCLWVALGAKVSGYITRLGKRQNVHSIPISTHVWANGCRNEAWNRIPGLFADPHDLRRITRRKSWGNRCCTYAKHVRSYGSYPTTNPQRPDEGHTSPMAARTNDLKASLVVRALLRMRGGVTGIAFVRCYGSRQKQFIREIN